MDLSIIIDFIRRRARAVLFSLVLGLIAFKVCFLGFRPDAILPEKGFDVVIRMTLSGGNGIAAVESYLPESKDHQQISLEEYTGRSTFSTLKEDRGILGIWRMADMREPLEIQYRFHAKIRGAGSELSSDLLIPESYPDHLLPYLYVTPDKSGGSPFLEALYGDHIPATDSLLPVVKAIFEYTRLREANTEDRRTATLPKASRQANSYRESNTLFLNLARRANIPGRFVNGLILDPGAGTDKTQWIELFITGQWVPFDIKNGHFASLPDHYLTLYYGNAPLFSHSENIDLAYSFGAQESVISNDFLGSAIAETSPFLNPFLLWQAYLGTGMPLVSLKILLLLPLASTVVVFFRNIVGLETYGIFLPALIATSGLHSGLLPAVTGFLLVTLLVALLHFPLERKGLLYLPKLSFMLLAVVATLLGMSYAGIRFGLTEFVSLSFLPLVILASSAEHLSRHLEEDGPLEAVRVMGITIAVISACFLLLDMASTQWLILAFPELLVVVGVANLWMGRWMGLRMSEYGRFRWLMNRDKGSELLSRFHREVLGINRRNGEIIREANKRRDLVLANDKDLTKRFLEHSQIPVPPTLIVFSEIRDLKEKWVHLEGLKEFVVKPAKGLRGNNIRVVTRRDGNWVTPGGKCYDKAALQKHIADIIFGSHCNGRPDKALVEYRVHPHPSFVELYEHGLPDLRVIIHHGQVIQAMLRVPTSASDGKANLHQGALGIGIDLKTGGLRRGFYANRYVDVHPDSGASLRGLRIPDWLEVIAISHRTANLVPLQYLGVDIVIDRDRGPLVLEINARPGLQIQNINELGIRRLLEKQIYAKRNI